MSPPRAYFDGRTYWSGQVYSFRQLPEAVKEDLTTQGPFLDVAHGKPYKKLRYRFVLIPPEELTTCLERSFGADVVRARIQQADIVELADSIKRFGLFRPPVEGEGYHRAFAMALLGWPMPYFEVEGTPAYPLSAICRYAG